MKEIYRIKEVWDENIADKYTSGIQSIIRNLSNEHLIDYIVDNSKELYLNDKSRSKTVNDLKLNLAKKELLHRLNKTL